MYFDGLTRNQGRKFRHPYCVIVVLYHPGYCFAKESDRSLVELHTSAAVRRGLVLLGSAAPQNLSGLLVENVGANYT
jgi:hypothetical protein